MPETDDRHQRAARIAGSRMANRRTPLIRNTWYVAAFAEELGKELLPRTILGQRLVLFRLSDGRPVALHDRCVHRSFPLSKGRRDGDTIVCGYHGLRYDASGSCVEIPSEVRCPKGIGVRSYPLVDDGPVTWIWMGEPAMADETLIPRQAWMRDAGWPSSRERFHLGASYVSLHENLLDLTHLSFLHANSFGTPDYASAPYEIELDDERGRYALTRSVIPTRLPPVWAKPTGLEGIDAARVARSEFLSPALHVVNVRFYRADKPPDEQPDRQIRTAHIVTPETAISTHYLIYHARNFAQEEGWVTEFMHENLAAAFHEDIEGLEAIEELLAAEQDDETYEITLASDKPAVAMRRRLKRLADAEQAADRRGGA